MNAEAYILFATALIMFFSAVGGLWWWSAQMYSRHRKTQIDTDNLAAKIRLQESDCDDFERRMMLVLMVTCEKREDREAVARIFIKD